MAMAMAMAAGAELQGITVRSGDIIVSEVDAGAQSACLT